MKKTPNTQRAKRTSIATEIRLKTVNKHIATKIAVFEPIFPEGRGL
jgi:hypothetical protein